ncbi:MAG: hypothetical protein H7836_17405, partial [Magnetococcus sp. YQC-3]
MKSFAKKYPKTHRFLKGAGSALKVAHQAYSMARVVASIVNSERKYFDSSVAWDTNTTASVTCLTSMAQGDTNVTRNGNSIALKSLQIHGYWQGDTGVPSEQVRIMIVRDNDNLGGTAPVITDVLEGSGVLQLRNKNTPKRFTMLYDKIFVGSTDSPVKKFDYFKKFRMMKDKNGNPTKSVKCLFDGTTANDYTRGHIFLIAVGNTATASTTSTLQLNTR